MTTRFADPTRCPDCGGAISHQTPACPTCALPLRGPVAHRLFESLSLADRLLVELRASALAPAGAPAPVAATAAPGNTVGGTAPGLDGLDSRPPRQRGLSAASVPQILLGLGAACVLVAALVFLAVAWSMLGVGGRTGVLVALTGAAGALTVLLSRRALRGAAEALGLVSLGLLTLDVFGAADAGWFGNRGLASFLVLLGSALLVASVGLGLLVRRTPVGRLTGPQIVAGGAVLVATTGVAGLDESGQGDLLAAVVLAGAATEALRRLVLPLAAALGTTVTGLFWLVLVGFGVERATQHPTYAALWGDLHVWPLLGAAALAGGLAAVRTLPLWIRVSSAGAGLAVAVFAVISPALGETPTLTSVVVAAALVAAGLLAWFARRPWGLTAALTQAIGGLWLAAVGVELAAHGLAHLSDIVSAPAGTLGGALPVSLPFGSAQPWVLPLALVVLVGTVTAVAEASPEVDALVGRVADLRVLAALGALTVVLTTALYGPPVWILVTQLLATAVGFQAWWLHRRSVVPLVLAAGFLAAAVGVATYDAWLATGALAVTLACAVHAHLAARDTTVAQVSGAGAAAALGGLAWTVGAAVDADPSVVVLVGLALLAAVGTTTYLLPAPWWRCPSPVGARAGVEAGAAATAAPLALLGVLLAPGDEQATWAAGYLTLGGVAVTATALLRTDRRALGWPGGVLLAAASWVRLWDLGVREPEAYTLPSAAALTVVGLWHLRTRPGSSTLSALGPALSLALVPSLVWALAEPEGWRVLLLGLACLGLVVGGAQLRWTAPMLFGAVVGGVLVVRLAAPYIGDALPRWVVIGLAGALLIALGVTWERRLQQARQVRAYVHGLR